MVQPTTGVNEMEKRYKILSVNVVSITGVGKPSKEERVAEPLTNFRRGHLNAITPNATSKFSEDILASDTFSSNDGPATTEHKTASDDYPTLLASPKKRTLAERQNKMHVQEYMDIHLTVAFILSALSALTCGILTLIELGNWWYALLAYILGGNLTLLSVLLLPYRNLAIRELKRTLLELLGSRLTYLKKNFFR